MGKELEYLSVPTELSDITLQEWVNWQRASEGVTDEKELEYLLLEVFCNVSRKDVRNLPSKVTKQALETLLTALKGEQTELVKEFEIDGVSYGFIPNLDDISTGEYMDIDEHLDWKDFHYTMACLYRPIAFRRNIKGLSQYEIMPYEPTQEKAELMLKAPINVCMSARVFFWTLGKELQEHIHHSLMEQTKKKEMKGLIHLTQKKRDGIQQYFSWLERDTSKWTTLPLNPYISRLNS